MCFFIDITNIFVNMTDFSCHFNQKDTLCIPNECLCVILTYYFLLCRSRDLREEFEIDFLRMATTADIPLEKVEKMKPFLLKYSKQAGTLPMATTLHSTYIPRLLEQHFSSLKQLLLESASTPIHITAGETIDCRGHNILNVLARLVLVVKHTSLMLSKWRVATTQHLVELS